MGIEQDIQSLTHAVHDIPDIPKEIEVKISDSFDSTRIARALESIADSLAVIARSYR